MLKPKSALLFMPPIHGEGKKHWHVLDPRVAPFIIQGVGIGICPPSNGKELKGIEGSLA